MGVRQDRGRLAERQVRDALCHYGRIVKLSHVASHDILVDGLPIEVKAAIPSKFQNGSRAWVFNIHRHARLNESGVYGYVLRLNRFPGHKRALYMFMRAPLERKTIIVSMASILRKSEFYKAVQDFYKFARGEQCKRSRNEKPS